MPPIRRGDPLRAGARTFVRVTSEPFRDPAFLGHQLREPFTHVLVTLPLGLGVCFALARHFSTPSAGPTAQAHGQTTSLAALLFPHFAEHGLGYCSCRHSPDGCTCGRTI
jgi:hypothetical protein